MKRGKLRKMQTFTVVNKKGGSGKTSTALAMVDLLRRKGRVLCVDMDPQGNMSAVLRADRSVQGTSELLQKKDAKLEDYVQNVLENVDLVAGEGSLVDVEPALAKAVGREMRLAKALAQAKDYAFCIIDTPPSIGLLTVNALCAAEKAVIAANADAFSADGYAEIAGDVDDVREFFNPGLRVDGILLTRFNERTTLARQMVKEYSDLAERTGTKLYQTRIRECVAVREAQYTRQLLSDYSKKNNAVDDYTAWLEELEV